MIDIKSIRADFPILDTAAYEKPLVYLDNAATAQKPLPVLEALHSFYTESCANIHRGIHYLSERASASYEHARESVRAFINAEHAREIVFTRGTTEAINIVARSFGAQQVGYGDEVVVSEMEHHSNIVPWQMLCDRVGARLRVIPIDDTGRLRMEQLGSLMNERTRLLAICAVSNVLGSANPVAEVIARAHEQEVPVLIDAAQAVQHMPIDVRSLGCDFLVFSGHKMFAETGIGVLFAKEHWLKNMPPYQYGGGMIETVNFERTTFAEIPFRFEAGTPNIAGAISLNTAIDYIRTIGLENICAHEQTLRRYALNRLSGIDGMTVYGNGENGCGSVSFNLDGVSPYDVAVLLDKMGIAVRSGTHCAEPVMRRFGVGGMVRASFALYNTCEEVDLLVDGVGRAGAMLR